MIYKISGADRYPTITISFNCFIDLSASATTTAETTATTA